MNCRRMLVGAGVSLMLCSVVSAAVPRLINFQGILKDGSGNPVADASYSVTFTLYTSPSGGSALWTEVQSVATTGGLFTALLGSTNPVPDTSFLGSDCWLGIAVSPDGEMAVRQQLVSVGYSYRVNSVDSALGGAIAGDVSVAGTVQMSGFKLPTGALNGSVLTSDAGGNGTWQAAGAGTSWNLTALRLDG